MADDVNPLDPVESLAIANVPEPEIVSIHSAVMGTGGQIYLSDEFNHRIVVIGADGTYLRHFGSKGKGDGQFWYPRGLALVKHNGAPELVVCDAWNHRIQRFDTEGNFITAFGYIGEDDDHFNEPVEVIVDADENLLILDSGNHRVKKHTMDGKFIVAFGKQSTRDDQNACGDAIKDIFENKTHIHGYFFPKSFAMMDDGALVIADTNNRRLCHVSADGEAIGVFKLDVDHSPPYRYPSTIQVLSDSLVYVGSSGHDFDVIDIRHPWRIGTIGLPGQPGRPSTIVTRTGDGERLTVVDSARGVIERFDLDPIIEKINSAGLPEPPAGDELTHIPNRWTEQDRDRWLAYLDDADSAGDTVELTRRFVTICIASATTAAQQLNDIEEAICKVMTRYYDALDEARKKKAQRADHQDARNRMVSETLTLRLEEGKRALLRRALIKNVAAVCRVSSGEDSRKAFVELLASDYSQREKDYHEVVKWFRERIEKPESLNPTAFVHGFQIIAFLLDHFDYLRMALERLTGDKGYRRLFEDESHFRSELSRIVARTGIADNALALIGRMAETWGALDIAETVYRAGMEYALGDLRVRFALLLTAVLQRAKKSDDKARELLAEAARAVTTVSWAGRLIEKLLVMGDYEWATELYKRFVTDKMDSFTKQRWKLLNDAIAVVEKSPLTITLTAGQSTADVAEGIENVTYIRSIHVSDSAFGEAAQPHLVLPLSETKLLVSDFWDHALWVYEESGDNINCRKVIDGEVLFYSLSLAPSGEIVAVHVPDPYNPDKGSRLVTVDITNGTLADFSANVSCQLPPNPYKAFYLPDGRLLVYDLVNGQCALVSRDLSKAEIVFEPQYKYDILELAPNGFICTSSADKVVYRHNLETGEGVFMDDTLMVAPLGVGVDAEGRTHVTTHLGWQVYGPKGNFLFQAQALADETGLMPVNQECYTIHACDSCLGGNLLLASRVNRAIHIIRA